MLCLPLFVPFQLCHLALSALALGVLMLLPGYVCAGQTRYRNNSVCVLSNCSEGIKPQNPNFPGEAVGTGVCFPVGVLCPQWQWLCASQPRPRVFLSGCLKAADGWGLSRSEPLPELVSGQKLLFQLLVRGRPH